MEYLYMQKNTIMVSGTLGFQGYIFEVDIIRVPYAKNTIYKVTRLNKNSKNK